MGEIRSGLRAPSVRGAARRWERRLEPRPTAAGPCALVAFVVLASCAPERRVPRETGPPKDGRAAAESVSDASPSDGSLEDPPYAPDSVFKPETHRTEPSPLPADAILVDAAIEVGRAAEFSHFGSATALDGDVAVGGAPYADRDGAMDAGVVHVHRRAAGAWRNEASLASPSPQEYERLGMSVAVSGDTIVAGADRSEQQGAAGAGAAHVFERHAGSWGHAATLVASRALPDAAVGFSVCIEADTIAVGAPGSAEIGEVLVFERRDGRWKLTAELTAPGQPRWSGLGHAVALSGDTLLAGAVTTSEPLWLCGAAHVYRRLGGTWAWEATLLPDRPEALSRFGSAVALKDGTALVSAPRATVGASSRAGKSFLFRREGDRWVQVQEITNEVPRTDEEFGRAVALSSRLAVVGSQFADAAGLGTGSATLFSFDGTRLSRAGTMLARDRQAMNEFGFATAASEDTVLIGAPRRGPRNNAVGATYVHSVRR